MSRDWRTRIHRVIARPAPPGTRTALATQEGPPDGWLITNASWAQRAGSGADAAGLRLTAAAARTVSRRTMLKRIGTIGAAAGLGAGTLLAGRQPSFAHEPLQAGCGPKAKGCGPSPLCKAIACNDSHNCKLRRAGVRARGNASTNHWEGIDCVSDSAHVCWHECCNGTLKRCCDCCVNAEDSRGTASCNVGCSAKKRCICRGPIWSC
jgi:hypothetical protein